MRIFFLVLISAHLYGQTLTFPPSGSMTVAGSNTQLQYNNAGTLAGTANITTTGDHLILAQVADPTTSEYKTNLYLPQNSAIPYIKAHGGVTTPLSPDEGSMVRAQFIFVGTSASPSIFGNLNSTIGTASAQTPASGTPFTSAKKVRFTSTAANANGGLRSSSSFFTVGFNGFTAALRFACVSPNTSSRCIGGIMAGASFPSSSVEPTNITSIVALGYETNDANYSIIHNDATGTATKVDLGSNFPAGNSTQGWYELVIHNPPNTTTFQYRVTNLVNGSVATGTLTSNVPPSSSQVAPFAVASSSTTTAICEIGNMFIQSYY